MATQLSQMQPLFQIKKAYAAHKDAETKQLRNFGLILCVFFVGFLALGPILSHKPMRVWPLPIGFFFGLFGLAFPKALKPLYQAWMVIGGILGWINTRILLGVVFFVVVTPLSVLKRLFGKDTMGLRYDKNAPTYRSVLKETSHFERQF